MNDPSSLDELSAGLKRAVEAERGAPAVPPPALMARLQRSFDALDPGPAAPPSPPPPGIAAAGVAAKVFPAVVALVVGGIGGWWWRGPQLPPQVVERVVRVEVPAPPPAVAPPPVSAPVPSPTRPPRPAPLAVAPPVAPPAPVEPERVDDAELARERALLDMGRSAMVQDRPQAALDGVALHAAQFPAGVLAEEREALRVRALLRLGKRDEARAALEAMQRRWPDSVLLGPLKSALP